MNTPEKFRKLIVSGEPLPTSITYQEVFDINEDGQNALHMAASVGRLHDIPREFITQESLTRTDSGGQTVFHVAASQRPNRPWEEIVLPKNEGKHLNQIPGRFLTKRNLLRKDDLGATVLHTACETGTAVRTVPKKVLTKDALLSIVDDHNCPLLFNFLLTKEGIEWLPPEFLTAENMQPRPYRKTRWHGLLGGMHEGSNGLAKAAIAGTLKYLPKHLLTKDLLTAPNPSGRTPIWYAAANNHLDQIPEEFITDDVLKGLKEAFDLQDTILRMMSKFKSSESQ